MRARLLPLVRAGCPIRPPPRRSESLATCGKLSAKDFDGRRMTEERGRTCARPVRSRLIDCDEVAFARLGKLHPVSQQIERRAQSTHDGRDLALRAANAVSDDHGVVLAQHLAEIA